MKKRTRKKHGNIQTAKNKRERYNENKQERIKPEDRTKKDEREDTKEKNWGKKQEGKKKNVCCRKSRELNNNRFRKYNTKLVVYVSM